MKPVRLIARLDIKGPHVVKGICFEGLRVMGKPEDLACEYYRQGADELLYIDTVASLYERNNLIDVVKEAASQIFIPLTVGGGIRSLNDAQTLLRAGADRVAINTAAVRRPALITEIASVLGAQAVVVSMHVKKIAETRWEIYVDNGREKTGIDALEWAKKSQALGAGELLVTSVDRDGTKKGFELEFLKQLKEISIPVMAGGGAGSVHDICDVIRETHVDAVAIASILHYKKATIQEIKDVLAKKNIKIANHQ